MRILLKKLETAFASAVHIKNFGRSESLLVEVTPEKLIEVSAWLRMEESFRMDFLENFSIYEMKGKFVFSYFMRSSAHKLQLVLRSTCTSTQSSGLIEHPSVSGIWPQAESFEVEHASLFGFKFIGSNPKAQVRRNFGEFTGYPLRKSFEWGDRVEI